MNVASAPHTTSPNAGLDGGVQKALPTSKTVHSADLVPTSGTQQLGEQLEKLSLDLPKWVRRQIEKSLLHDEIEAIEEDGSVYLQDRRGLESSRVQIQAPSDWDKNRRWITEKLCRRLNGIIASEKGYDSCVAWINKEEKLRLILVHSKIEAQRFRQNDTEDMEELYCKRNRYSVTSMPNQIKTYNRVKADLQSKAFKRAKEFNKGLDKNRYQAIPSSWGRIQILRLKNFEEVKVFHHSDELIYQEKWCSSKP